jgi:hypothetical protein
MRVVYRSPFVSTGRQRQWHPCFDSKLLLPPTLHRSSRYRRYTLLWLPRHRSVPSSVFSHRRNNVQSSISRIAGARPANSRSRSRNAVSSRGTASSHGASRSTHLASSRTTRTASRSARGPTTFCQLSSIRWSEDFFRKRKNSPSMEHLKLLPSFRDPQQY